MPYNQIPETDELSFEKGEVFLVHNDLGDGWLWVTSQSTGLSGIVNKGLVQEIVSTHYYLLCYNNKLGKLLHFSFFFANFVANICHLERTIGSN